MSRFVSVEGKEITWTASDSGVVVLNLANSQYHSLNETAAILWPLIVSGAQESTLVEHLGTKYDVDIATVREDVATLVAELASRNLIAVSD